MPSNPLRLFALVGLVVVSLVGIHTRQIQAQNPDLTNQPGKSAFNLFLPLVSVDADLTLDSEARALLLAPEEELPPAAPIIAAAATSTPLSPVDYTTLKGSDGDQPVAALAVMDSPNTAAPADWEKYLEFYGKYTGYRTYVLPATINPSTITALQVKAHYKGPLKNTQSWSWHIYDWPRKKWVLLGDNRTAPEWQWHLLTFTTGGTLANYIDSNSRELRIRLQSNNAKDDMDLDYEAVLVSYNDNPTPTPTTVPGNWWKPTPGTSWQIQLQGKVDTSFNVQVYFIDLFDVPTSTISALKQQGRKVVCYFSAGSWEDWRDDKHLFPPAVIGNELKGWDGEYWLDIRNLAALGPIMTARMDVAVSKGCDGVDPDNIDAYTYDRDDNSANDTGFSLTAQHQLTYNRWLAQQAHARGLAIGLKNDLDQIGQLLNDFDWALNEQCFAYNECEKLLPFVNAGKPVFGIEYSGKEKVFCPKANAWNFDFLKKKLNLKAWRLDCRTFSP